MRNEELRETLSRFELNSERKSAHDSLLAVVSVIVFITVIAKGSTRVSALW